jgi:hypothetical protein
MGSLYKAGSGVLTLRHKKQPNLIPHFEDGRPDARAQPDTQILGCNPSGDGCAHHDLKHTLSAMACEPPPSGMTCSHPLPLSITHEHGHTVCDHDGGRY